MLLIKLRLGHVLEEEGAMGREAMPFAMGVLRSTIVSRKQLSLHFPNRVEPVQVPVLDRWLRLTH